MGGHINFDQAQCSREDGQSSVALRQLPWLGRCSACCFRWQDGPACMGTSPYVLQCPVEHLAVRIWQSGWLGWCPVQAIRRCALVDGPSSCTEQLQPLAAYACSQVRGWACWDDDTEVGSTAELEHVCRHSSLQSRCSVPGMCDGWVMLAAESVLHFKHGSSASARGRLESIADTTR